MKSNSWAIVSLICSAAYGCGSGADVPESGIQSGKGPPTIVQKAGAASTQPASPKATVATAVIPEDIARLFSRMDSVGLGSEDAYRAELQQFTGAPGALTSLAKLYATLPKEALSARWKAVEAAGEIRNAESLKFLQGVALSPAEIDPNQTGDNAGDKSFRMRYTAAVNVVKLHLSNVDGAEASVEVLLQTADPQIAQMVGVELFGAGKLTDAQRGMLTARGIPADFRKIEGAELDKLRAIDPEGTRHQGDDTRTRPRSVSVPALSAGE